MSKPTDNTQDKLGGFLNETGKPGFLPADDFEKDAAEGFTMLDNTEALDLKNKLDARMEQEVLAPKEERSKNKVWFAAAGLILLVGFSVYFVRNNNDAGPEKIAIN